MRERIRLPLTLLGAITVALLCVAIAMLYDQGQRRGSPDPTANVQTPTRDAVNAAVVRLILAGRSTELYAFFSQEAGDPVRAMLYCNAAIVYHAPVDLVEAVAWWESGHQVGGVGPVNTDGSVDVFPMGLNSYTYKKVSMQDLERAEYNIPEGVEHLVNARASWGVSWEAALAVFNHGSPTGLDQRQIDYVAAVTRHEFELDRRFAARFPDAL